MSKPGAGGDRWPAAGVALAVFATLAWGVSPAHAWLDAGEIAAAGAELGVMHPTGAPGLTHLLQFACALPLGSLGFRMGLASAALAACAVGIVSRVFTRRGGGWGSTLLFGTWLAVGLTFSRQARLVEIYAYGAVLLALVIDAFDPRRVDACVEAGRSPLPGRLLGVAAAVLGVWSFGDLRLALALPVAFAWWRSFRRAESWSFHAPWVVVMASLPVLGLALASARGPWADWGDPDGLRRLWEHVDATSIREAFGGQILPGRVTPWLHQSRLAFERLVEDLGPLGPLVALLGGWTLLRDRSERRFALGLVYLFLVEWIYTVGINPMGGADRQTGIPLALVAVTLSGAAFAPWEARAGRLRWAALPLAAALLWTGPLTRSLADASVTRSWGPHAWTRETLARLPPGAALLTSSDDLAAGWRAAQSLEGARPDLAVYPAQHLYRPVPDAVVAERPDLAPALEAAYRGCTEGERARAFAEVWSRDGRPLFVESPGLDMVRVLPAELDGSLPLGRVSATPRELTPSQLRAHIAAELERRRGTLPTSEDLRRLATAVSARVRAWIRGRGDDPESIAAAIDAYRQVIDRTGVELPGILVSLGALLDRQGRSEDAVMLTRRALALDPGRRLALMNLALYQSRDPVTLPEALALAREAAELHPEEGSTWRRLMQVCGAAEDEACSAQARAGLEAARAQRPRNRHPSCLRRDAGPQPESSVDP